MTVLLRMLNWANRLWHQMMHNKLAKLVGSNPLADTITSTARAYAEQTALSQRQPQQPQLLDAAVFSQTLLKPLVDLAHIQLLYVQVQDRELDLQGQQHDAHDVATREAANCHVNCHINTRRIV